MEVISVKAISTDMPHMSKQTVATRQYAYLVQQMGEVISLSNYVLQNILEDDHEQWLESVEQPHVSKERERAVALEAQLQLERRRVFNSIMLCQIYDTFDLYCVRMRKATKQTGKKQPGESSLEYNKRTFLTMGLTFLRDQQEYKKVVMIKDSRNLITHNHGVVDDRFHRDHPDFSDGIDNPLRIYSEELQEHAEFLTRACYDLDRQVSCMASLSIKPLGGWSGPSSIEGEDEGI